MSQPRLTCWHSLLLPACLFAATGCQPTPAPVPATDLGEVASADSPPELSLAAQMAAVERGESTRILVEREVLSDRELIALGKLTKLTDLLLDHPESEFHEGGIAALADLPNLQHLRIRGRGINTECPVVHLHVQTLFLYQLIVLIAAFRHIPELHLNLLQVNPFLHFQKLL